MDNAPTIDLADPSQDPTVIVERRRRGRVDYSNPALIEILRHPSFVPPETEAIDDAAGAAVPAHGRAHRGVPSAAIADIDSVLSRHGDMLGLLRHTISLQSQSVESAVVLAKRYCRDNRYEQEWAEFLAGKAWKIRSFLAGEDYPRGAPNADSINALIAKLVSLSEVVRRICLVSGRWGTPEANRAVARVIGSLGSRARVAGEYAYWSGFRAFCASLCFYWTLAGTLARKDFTIARSLMHTRIAKDTGEDAAVLTLPLVALGSIEWKVLKGLEQQRMPASEFLFALFEQEITDAAVDPGEAEDLFDHLEFLISLEFSHLRLKKVGEDGSGRWFWTPLGRFICRRNGCSVIERLAAHKNLPGDHALLQAGLLGGRPESADEAVEAMRHSVNGGRPPHHA